jgi:hypothetical protein
VVLGASPKSKRNYTLHIQKNVASSSGNHWLHIHVLKNASTGSKGFDRLSKKRTNSRYPSLFNKKFLVKIQDTHQKTFERSESQRGTT